MKTAAVQMNMADPIRPIILKIGWAKLTTLSSKCSFSFPSLSRNGMAAALFREKFNLTTAMFIKHDTYMYIYTYIVTIYPVAAALPAMMPSR